MSIRRTIAATAALAALALAGCSSESAPDASGTTTPGPAVVAAVEDYRGYLVEQVALSQAGVADLAAAIAADDLVAAQAAYAPSRVGWERIEPVAGLVEELDGRLDARVDDFASVTDPAFTGWHRIEHLLFADGTTVGAGGFAEQLQADLAVLAAALPALDIAPARMAIGASELVEEISLGKITGEENRYAKTDLWDIEANLAGSQQVVQVLRSELAAADPELLAELDAAYQAALATLAPLRAGDGWVLYCLPDDEYPSARCPAPTVDAGTRDRLQAQTAALAETTSRIGGSLGLA
jgi:iron uptake system component EfeO